jgi:hypothetical protein
MGTMEVLAKGGLSYGTLEPASGGKAVLRCNGVAVMTLEKTEGDLCMSATTMDGRLLASAGKDVRVGSQRVECHDAWKLQVKPGLDAVLISACMLSVLLFGS